MLIVDMLLKKAMKNELDLMGPAQEVAKELMSIPDFGTASSNVLEEAHQQVKNFKKAILMVAGSAAQKLMMQLAKEQEILMNIADMVIEVYVAESVLLRVEKLALIKGEAAVENQMAMMQVYVYDVADKINKYGKDAIISFVEGDEQKMMLTGLKRFTKQNMFNVKETRRKIADKLIAENKYCY